jgi:ferric-dicitrate binding protein FerR (iron transport regulator)
MDNQEFQNILFRYFRGQLVDSEYDSLHKYLEDPKSRDIFEKAKTDWENNPETDELTQKNLSRLKFKINHRYNNKKQQPISRRLWLRVIAAAAILTVGLVIGGVVAKLVLQAPSEKFVFETPRGEKSMVKLPDGSEVWLNAKSKLVYNSSSTHRREVELTGEAFFKIVHNENAPFCVKTNQCVIEDLGTEFNVMAYDDFGRNEVTLLNGKVNIRMEEGQQELKPGQTLILKDHQYTVEEVDAEEASSWVYNKFNFHNIPLTELIQRLEYWYDVDIILENKSGKDYNFSGTFKNEETVWQVLDAIKVYTPIEFQKTEFRKIKITVK